MRSVLFTGILVLVVACTSKTANVFPGDQWERSSPAKQGIDEEGMKRALDYLKDHSKHNGNREVVIIRNGYMIYCGEQADSVHNIWSCSKTFTSTVLGLLIDEGRLNLEERASSYDTLLTELYKDVTFKNFASMTSGYSAVGDSRWKDADYSDWSWTPYDPDIPFFKPGKAYAYWDEAQMMFGRVLTGVLKRPMQDYLKEKVTDPMSMGEWNWFSEGDLDEIPINNGCTNVFINALQFARWGWLFLNEGNWDGKQLISREWVQKATSVQVPASLPMGETDRKETVGPGCYGFNWWINGEKADGAMKLPGAPQGSYFASGLNNNKCIIIPEWNMVVVRMGEDGHPENQDIVYGTFLKLLGKSILDKI